ncbi:MAG: hypothetical protein ABJB11_12145 [Ferruginibacter sp.]
MKINSIQLKMAKLIIICSLFVCCCFSDAVASNQEQIVVVKKDPVPVQQVIIKFLKWYKINLNKANNFPILIKDSADNFMLNKAASTSYLNFLKSSQCISQKYIELWKVFFDDKSSELRDHPNQSDIPEGFDMDFVLITQEPDIILNKIANLKFKIVSMNEKVALIGVRLPSDKSVQYEFEMYKTKAGWQIGYISTPNYD